MPEPLVVVAATANAHKLDEMRAIFGDAVVLQPRPEALPEVVEDADSFVGNARLKAVAVCAATGHAALADDSGLEVDALDGAPGVESAYYGGGDHDDAANRNRLLGELESVADLDRTARFRTVIVVCWPNGSEVVVEGVCDGVITRAERGSAGFGYDPIFAPAVSGDRTFAEHSATEKNTISHRSAACKALLAALADQPRS